jgi:D-alanyl-D-alanine endopeptidase (penicillin-binding protein 7)
LIGYVHAFVRRAWRDTTATRLPTDVLAATDVLATDVLAIFLMTQNANGHLCYQLFRILAGFAIFVALIAGNPSAVSAAAKKNQPHKLAKKSAKKSATKATCPAKGKKATKKTTKTTTKPTTKKSTRKAAKKHHPTEKHVVAMKGNLPNVQSMGALVIDLDSGQELFARRPDNPRAIASISKLAATLTVMDHNLDLDGLTTIKKVDVDVARGGAKSRLPDGMTLSNRDLLHAALLGSDNRAVSALGRAVGLGTSQFTTAMNRKVASLGLRFTRFREPTGLSSDNQSTPRETIELLKHAMANPILGPIVRKPEYNAHPVSRPPIHYNSTHRPAARANLQVLGGKTGYNDSARYCLVIAARIDGHNYGMSFLGTEGELTRFGDVARVADWLIAHKPKRSPSTAPQGPPPPDVILAPAPLDGGTGDAR